MSDRPQSVAWSNSPQEPAAGFASLTQAAAQRPSRCADECGRGNER